MRYSTDTKGLLECDLSCWIKALSWFLGIYEHADFKCHSIMYSTVRPLWCQFIKDAVESCNLSSLMCPFTMSLLHSHDEAAQMWQCSWTHSRWQCWGIFEPAGRKAMRKTLKVFFFWCLLAVGKPAYRCINATCWAGVWSSRLAAITILTHYCATIYYVYCILHYICKGE